jgi:hypothetical protein
MIKSTKKIEIADFKIDKYLMGNYNLIDEEKK